VRFTLRAAAELDELLTYIDEQSPHGARAVKTRIQVMLDLVAHYPDAGRPAGRRGLRRVAAHPFPYLIFYRASDSEIVIHGFRHAARRPSSMPQ
jgi:toxin ParE1/3/4